MAYTRRVFKYIFCAKVLSKNKTLLRMHKLHQRCLPLDPTGIILQLAVTVQGPFKLFVCIKIDPSGEEILYLVPRSVYTKMSLSGHADERFIQQDRDQNVNLGFHPHQYLV